MATLLRWLVLVEADSRVALRRLAGGFVDLRVPV